ncbi:MAG: leucine-rich repeat protein [Prevotella sp.]|nr:leucine-rich repeat protein [Prevotella sp.]
MKKILYIFVFLLVSITASAYDAKIDGIYYDLVPKAKVAIVTEGDTKYEGDISIPSTFEYEGVEYTVTEITGKAFYYSTNLRSLTIPNSVKTIGRQAFFCCENLRKLVLPDELEELPSSICSMCHQLTEIHMPNRLRTISADAFYECVSLTSISLPEDLVEIGGDAFRDCISLTSMVIPDHVSILGAEAFRGCTNLTSIRLPKNLSNVPNCCFTNCPKLTNITLPNGIDAIGDDAFSGCESLTQLTIPNSVKSIGKRAFERCGFTTFEFPSGNIQVGYGLFFGCSQLKGVVSWPFPYLYGETFKDCTALEEFVIPEGVREIGSTAFEGCTNLTTVSLPSSLNYIDYYVFKDCKNLKDVYCYCEELPRISPWDDIFSGSYIEYATLHIPTSVIETYRSTYPWSEFGTIVAIESTGISEALPQDKVQSESWYTLEGIRMAQPRKGVYIKNGKVVVIK